MSIKEIKEGIEKEKVVFGLKETMKMLSKKEKKEEKKVKKGKEEKEGKEEEKSKEKKQKVKVFVAKDARKETIKELEKAGILFSILKDKAEISKELNLGFESEVFYIE